MSYYIPAYGNMHMSRLLVSDTIKVAHITDLWSGFNGDRNNNF